MADITTAQPIAGYEGSVGPFRGQSRQPHVYARDIQSGAGNCHCGSAPGDWIHTEIAPGVPVPNGIRLASYVPCGARRDGYVCIRPGPHPIATTAPPQGHVGVAGGQFLRWT